MPDYLRIIGDCFPGVQAFVEGNADPTVYANIQWVSTPVSQAELDASPCGQGIPVDINGNPDYTVYAGGAGLGYYYGVIPFKSGTTKFTSQDVAPPITQGTEIWSFTLTPNSATSLFSIMSSMQIDMSRSGPVVISLYRDNECVGATTRYCSGSNKPGSTSILFTDRPNTTSEITYSARIGKLNVSGTWYINRTRSYTLGDKMQQHFIIMENG